MIGAHLAELSEAALGSGGTFLLGGQQLLFLLQLFLQGGQGVSFLTGLNVRQTLILA